MTIGTDYTEEKLNQLTDRILGCAITVHRALGPGLQESVYHNALAIEFVVQKVAFESEKILQVHYRGQLVGNFRVDLLVENCVVVELKSVERHTPLFEAQLLNYLHLGNYPIGLLINFNNRLLKDGIKRMRI